MSWMFSCCSSLNSFTDISKWNIPNASYINRIFFFGCNSLSLLSGLSKWKNLNIINIYHIIDDCNNIINPNIIQNFQ